MMSLQMNDAEFQLRGIADPRLAVHVVNPYPAWLWSVDGTRVLWANPVGAKVFGAANATALSSKNFGPADAHRRQIAQLAGKLPATGAVRLQRLRGFGAPLGSLMTCSGARLEFDDGSSGILLAALESTGRTLSLPERLQGLIEGSELPVAAFATDGTLIAATEAARQAFGFRNLGEAGLEPARQRALMQGTVEISTAIGRVVLQRVGIGADIGLVALIATDATTTHQPVPDYEQPALSGEAPAEFALMDHLEADTHEPSPFVEPVADEPSAEPATAPANDEPSPEPRRHPLRFMWRMDGDGRFSIESDEFARLMGPRTAAKFDRPWSDIAKSLTLDPEDRVLSALATRATWSGVTLNWPVDGGEPLPVELSGLPVSDRSGDFTGYRGFGVCRDLDRLTQLAMQRYLEPATPVKPDDDAAATQSGEASATSPSPASNDPIATATSPQTDLETTVETPRNVVPFRPVGEPKSPVLTPVENIAFDELARQLSARLENEDEPGPAPPATSGIDDTVVELSAARQAQEANERGASQQDVGEQPGWLQQPEPPPRGASMRDRALLDLLPVGVLIYRLDRLVYANAAFLKRLGYPDLHALEEAGGLDALYVEPGVSSASSTSDSGTPVTISAPQATAEGSPAPAIDARLYTINWDDDAALALIFSGTAGEAAATAAAIVQAPHEPEPAPAAPSPAPAAGHANAEELGAILDTTADGIVMFD